MNSNNEKFELHEDSIFVCDMRPGFTEDGVACELPNGNYYLSNAPTKDQGLNSFSLQLENTSVDDENDIAIIGVEMARVGIYKRRILADVFNSDTEALFDWSDSKCDKKSNLWGGYIGGNSNPDGLYINIDSDCDCSIKYLLSNGSKVGIKVVPLSSQTVHAVDRSWTRVEISLGISELSFIDDRDYELEFKDVLEDVLTELCTIDEGASLIFVDEDSVNVEDEIIRFRPNYKGARKLNVFIQTSVGCDLVDRKLPLDIEEAIEQLDQNISVNDFAKVIYQVLKTARRFK